VATQPGELCYLAVDANEPLLADALDEHGGDTFVGDVVGARCGSWRVDRCRRCQSAVISVTAARAEDSSTMAFLAV